MPCFDLEQTFNCGQAFRWECDENGVWRGIARGKYLELTQKNGDILFFNTSLQDFENIWINYFDLNRNYKKIIEDISDNEILKNASSYGSGIRILRQEPWETLCSFIISQNNNIPRIKGIIKRLCENFGDKTEGGYTFPSAERISKLTIDDLNILKSGFRAKYILDAAQKVYKKEIELDALKDADIDSAREKLMLIKGVGPKVADCTLLFGLGFLNAFPKDVWIKRAITVLFDGEFPESAYDYAGIVQQYIFYYARETKLEI